MLIIFYLLEKLIFFLETFMKKIWKLYQIMSKSLIQALFVKIKLKKKKLKIKMVKPRTEPNRIVNESLKNPKSRTELNSALLGRVTNYWSEGCGFLEVCMCVCFPLLNNYLLLPLIHYGIREIFFNSNSLSLGIVS